MNRLMYKFLRYSSFNPFFITSLTPILIVICVHVLTPNITLGNPDYIYVSEHFKRGSCNASIFSIFSTSIRFFTNAPSATLSFTSNFAVFLCQVTYKASP